MESDTTVDDRPSPLSPPPVPSEVPATDVLTDAHCLKCGYALRGLIEYRCPECGTPFDPSDFVDTFVPKWPKLLLWWLLGLLAGTAVKMLWAMGLVSDVWSSEVEGVYMATADKAYHTVTAARWGLIVGLGLLATLGLLRRRDWGRRLAIAMFLGLALVYIGGVTAISALVSVRLGRLWLPYEWRNALGGAMLRDCIPGLILATYLATGLRRYSLMKGHKLTPLVVQGSRFSERSDWLLLLRLLLLLPVLNCAVDLARECSGWGWMYLYQVPGSVACYMLALAIASGGCILAVRRLWLDPARVRVYTCAAIGLVGCAWLVGAWYVKPGHMLMESSWSGLCRVAYFDLDRWLPLLAIVLFVFKGIDRSDIERVARLPRKGHHTPIWKPPVALG